MTPQQKAELPAGPPEGAASAWPRTSQEWNKKMKPIIQRRRSTSSAISKALSKSKHHSSREILSPTSPPENGFLSGAFAKPGAAFVLDERVQLTLGLQAQERHLLLFRNLLVVAKSKSSSSLKLKKQVPLSEVWTGSCLSEVSEKKLNPETSFVIGWPTTNYVVTFSSPEVKERWLSTLLWHIGEMKERESPKSLSMQITLVDGENTPSNAVVAVSNMDTADGVIKMATQQLGLPGRPSDYHLWVISGRDQPDYPLIGHEHPFSIVLRCLRDSADQLQGAGDHTLLVDEDGISALEQLPRGRQCQFVLKPRPHASVQLRRDIFQKHTRRKKSLIDWALRRSTSTPTGSPASQSPTNPRKLFGLSLTSVCADGSLPKPIMDILQLLYHEGPSTRGIFRRSANAKTCKELKEKLNSGDDVQVDGESVFVAAAVITDFLRNIPDSVLSSDMHGLWMEAMDKENRVHKVDAVKRLVNRLPEANRLLLRHLFGVLHHIQQNATENQMNAFNLALCIAPNMLWLPSPTGPEEESKATKKVAMLVQFLIENSSDVFGGDVASLFQRPEKKKSKSVDDLLIQRNDSSDDMESATSYQERAREHYGLGPEDILFGPSAELLLHEDREDWDLFREITACYQSQAGKDASADSYDLLEGEGGSFCSAGSLCSLSPARDRCSSEPSVCLSSQLPPPDHEPVARQSSCDATLLRSHGDYIRRLKELQLESRKLLDEGLSPSLGRARKGGFWRSPQSSRGAKKPGPPRVSLSNRSSFSSLSSPTTSPSASSLSSLDSAFSYCSGESSALSPASTPSLSFLFGPSARLQASLSPQVAKRSLKEWPKPLVSPLPLGPGHVDFCVETQAGGQEGSGCSQGGKKGFSVPISAPGSPPEEVTWGEVGTEPWHMETFARPLGISGSIQLGSTAHSPGGKRSPLVSRAAQRERSVKHIEIKSPEAAPRSQEGLKRTKITVYMAPKERSWCASPAGPEEEEEQQQEETSVSSQSSSAGTLCQRLPRSPPATRVHIPQTVFYGQNTPLVLQSTSRRYPREPVSRTSEAPIARSPRLAQEPGWASWQEGQPLESQGSGRAFRHTFRVFLPAAVHDTIQGYFSQELSKEYSVAGVETVERELLQDRAEWLRRQPCPLGASPEDRQSLMLAEETFV